MSRVFQDGTNLYYTAGDAASDRKEIARRWDTAAMNDGQITLYSTGGPFGDGYFSISTNNETQTLQKTIAGSSILNIAMWFWPNNDDGAPLIQWTSSGGTDLCCVTYQTGGLLELRRGSKFATVFATSTGSVSTSSWQHVEFYLKLSSSKGEYEIRRNGNVIMANTTGVDTTASGDKAFQIQLGGQCRYAHVVFYDDSTAAEPNTWIGPHYIETNMPNSDGSTMDWSPSSGSSGFNLVDDPALDHDTTYVESTSTGNMATFGFPDLSGSYQKVYGVEMVAAVRGGGENFKIGILSSSTQALSASIGLNSTYEYEGYWSAVHPGTTTGWTVAKVNNASALAEHF